MSNPLAWQAGPDHGDTVRIDGPVREFDVNGSRVAQPGLIMARRVDPNAVIAFADQLRAVALRQIEAGMDKPGGEPVQDVKLANPRRVRGETLAELRERAKVRRVIPAWNGLM